MPSLDGGYVHRDGVARGIQDRRHQRRAAAIGTPATVKAALEVGGLDRDGRSVEGGAELVNTQTPTISSTLNADQINKMPMATRNALNAVTFLPGVNTAGRQPRLELQRAAGFVRRRSRLDGVQQQRELQQVDRGLVRDGHAAAGCGRSGDGDDRRRRRRRRRPRRGPDGVRDPFGHQPVHRQRLSLSSATRASTRTTGSTRSTACRRTTSCSTSTAFRQGGPIVIPGVYDGRGKAFFFFNYEELRLPEQLHADAHGAAARRARRASSVGRTATAGVTRAVNVLELARPTAMSAAVDPTVRADARPASARRRATPGAITQHDQPEHQALRVAEPRQPGREAAGRSRSTTT